LTELTELVDLTELNELTWRSSQKQELKWRNAIVYNILLINYFERVDTLFRQKHLKTQKSKLFYIQKWNKTFSRLIIYVVRIIEQGSSNFLIKHCRWLIQSIHCEMTNVAFLECLFKIIFTIHYLLFPYIQYQKCVILF